MIPYIWSLPHHLLLALSAEEEGGVGRREFRVGKELPALLTSPPEGRVLLILVMHHHTGRIKWVWLVGGVIK